MGASYGNPWSIAKLNVCQSVFALKSPSLMLTEFTTPTVFVINTAGWYYFMNFIHGFFSIMIGFITCYILEMIQKRLPRVTKPIMTGKTPRKLLCAFEGKDFNKWLARA